MQSNGASNAMPPATIAAQLLRARRWNTIDVIGEETLEGRCDA
jgi:hypothetical protein